MEAYSGVEMRLLSCTRDGFSSCLAPLLSNGYFILRASLHQILLVMLAFLTAAILVIIIDMRLSQWRTQGEGDWVVETPLFETEPLCLK